MKKRIIVVLIVLMLLSTVSYLFAGIPTELYEYKIISATTLSALESLINDNAKRQWASGAWHVEGGICFDGKEYSVLLYRER